jgi:hypothetical protein
MPLRMLEFKHSVRWKSIAKIKTKNATEVIKNEKRKIQGQMLSFLKFKDEEKE